MCGAWLVKVLWKGNTMVLWLLEGAMASRGLRELCLEDLGY